MYEPDTAAEFPFFWFWFSLLTGGANSSTNAACVFSHGAQFIDEQFPGALSWFTRDFLILYAFLPGLAIVALLSFKIRDTIIDRL